HLQDPLSEYFPLYVRETQDTLFADTRPHINVRPELFDLLLYTQSVSEQEREGIGKALFYHTLAVSYTPAYKSENYSYLMQDWPRIPIPAEREALEASARLGQQVADLLRPDMPFHPAPEVIRLGVPTRVDAGQLTDADLRVTVRYSGVGKYEPPRETASGLIGGRLWWNTDCFWNDVPPEVWAFTIGGYPVVKKWLDYRHESKLGRPLRLEEVLYVQEMIQRIASLLALGPRLDANYAAVKSNTLPLDLARLGKQTLLAEPDE
ncbi:MAG TPA: type ISP restriction/modification enzyme, partial [Ktedonobacterales bacterium]|nr:type ISP restriction/modification enzyme [Ktedonobacterales bacterium]